ncbi:MAG: HAD family phosphatase [Campylobacterota bacterium]|nr:HAD family phosphatase [Campylobacterota bacterium]
MKKYILFDNDGVLVETEIWYYEANKKALSELNVELTFDTYMGIMARGGTAWEVATKKGISKTVIDAKRFERDIYYQEFLQSKPIEIDGVVDVLKELKKDFNMGIVTTSRRVDFDLIHNSRPIIEQMDFTLCVEEYSHAKPHPAPYLAGMKKFNALANECIVVEDSQRGLSSAVAAGIDCAIVHNEFTKTHNFSKATHRIQSLKELSALLKNV